MFQRGETIMRIKSMMKGMLAVVMAMSMAACSGAPAADQTSSESPSPAQTESTAATEQETIYDYKYTSNIYNTYRRRSGSVGHPWWWWWNYVRSLLWNESHYYPHLNGIKLPEHCCMVRQTMLTISRSQSRSLKKAIRSGCIHWMRSQQWQSLWGCRFSSIPAMLLPYVA